MLFVLFAAAAIVWALSALRWSVSRRGGRVAVLVTGCLAAGAALASIVSDVRTIRTVHAAADSRLGVRIIRRGDWWQLEYARSGTAFTTANELHVPAGNVVSLSWVDAPPPSIEGSLCIARDGSRCALVTGPPRLSDASFFRLSPFVHQRLRVVVEPPAAFERWFGSEAQPARSSAEGAALFESSGCGYCHVVRGAVSSPSIVAPDLTHFAARATIAGTRFPPSRAYLTGWIVDSRGMKPGSAMPRNALDPAVLHRLVAYVGSLR